MKTTGFEAADVSLVASKDYGVRQALRPGA
jgi:hypothetical protein